MIVRVALLWLLSLALFPAFAGATTRTWPGSPPCASTLQFCITYSSDNDVVQIASNGTIDENLVINKPLSVQAASGYRPVLAAGRFVRGDLSSGSGLLDIEGLTLASGIVIVDHSSGVYTVRVRRVTVLATDIFGNAEIFIRSTSTGDALSYDIAENNLNYARDSLGGSLHAAIQILGSTAAPLNGDIRYNRVDASGIGSMGILVDANDGNHSTRVFANQVRGGNGYGSISVLQGYLPGSGSGTLNATLVDNIVTPLPEPATPASGIAVAVYRGALNLHAFNNTVVGATYGLDVAVAAGSTVSGEIKNNLLTHCGHYCAHLSNSGSGTISNDYNLAYGGAIDGALTPGAHTVTADPLLRGSPGNARLSTGSPAIDAGDTAALNSLLTSSGLASVDADGLRRIKGSINRVDIGAFEYGDATFLRHINNADSTPDYLSVLDHPSLNGQASRFPQVTSNWNPDGGDGIYNTHPLGVMYTSAQWYLRGLDVAAFPDGARVNVFAPALGNGNFRHVVTAGSTNGLATKFSATGLTNHADRILLVTRNSDNSDGSLFDDPHPFGVFYAALGGTGYWYIAHLDGSALNAGGSYNVYWQEPSAYAFKHVTSAENIAYNWTRLDHPLLHGHEGIKFHVTQGYEGTLNPHQIGVYYNGTDWAIFNQDIASMPVGAEFHVVIDGQQAFESSDVIFADDFDA